LNNRPLLQFCGFFGKKSEQFHLGNNLTAKKQENRENKQDIIENKESKESIFNGKFFEVVFSMLK
jgi:hypothetical protein